MALRHRMAELSAEQTALREALRYGATPSTVRAERRVDLKDSSRALEAISRYRAGERVADIALDFGVSRQRVDQLMASVETRGYLGLTQHYRRAQRRVRAAAAAHREFLEHACPCKVCGVLTLASCCGKEHREIWLALRYHADHSYRQQQREALARWQLRKHPTGEKHAHALRFLSGEAKKNGRNRWLIPGSAVYRAAELCAKQHWPLFELLPDAIREQVLAGSSSQRQARPGQSQAPAGLDPGALVRAGYCPLCERGRWRSPIMHITRAHNLTRLEVRSAFGLGRYESVCDPELAETRRDLNRRRWSQVAAS